MAKKHGRSRRPDHRSATRSRATDRAHPPEAGFAEQPLIAGLRQALRSADPLAFVVSAAMIASIALRMEEEEHPEGWVTLIESFMEVDVAETTGVLHVVAAMTDDDLMRRRIGQVLAARRQPMSPWVTTYADARVTEAWFMTDELGDGDNVILGIEWPGGEAATAVVYVDHNMGTFAKDGFVIPEPPSVVVGRYAELASRDLGIRPAPTDLADARARVETALANFDRLHPDWQQDDWPMPRPFIEHVLTSMPTGGTGYRLALGDDETDAEQELVEGLLTAFLDSAYAAHLPQDTATAGAAAGLLWFALDHSGDALRWSHVVVEVALARVVPFDPGYTEPALDRIPEVLPALIRFAHHERRLSPDATAMTLAAVSQWLPVFEERRDPARRHGLVAGQLAALVPEHLRELYRDGLAAEVGSEAALRALDDEPLPDEPLRLDELDLDDTATARIHEVSAHIDALVADPPFEGFDVEFRTACRRLLRGLAERAPEVVARRNARADRTAAAVAYLVAKANGLVVGAGAPTTVQELMARFGQAAAPSQRVDALREAYTGRRRSGPHEPLGAPELLMSTFRHMLLELRDGLG